MEGRKKTNCWEFFSCQRELGSRNRSDIVCPVSITSCFDRVNGGQESGRYCWKIQGTFCSKHEDRGSFLFKEEHCNKCEFKQLVRREEGAAFVE